jgi:ribosomal protein L40E
MKCTRCQQENPPQAKFCLECGTALALKCRVCGTELPIGAKFCFECGQSLSAQLAIGSPFASPEVYTPKHLAEKILASKSALEGERKQVTVLFADMKGSMELLADRDPEETRKLFDAVIEQMMEAVHRYEGGVSSTFASSKPSSGSIDRLSEHFELLAHHASRGELWGKTVDFMHQAGKKAALRSATQEAIGYFEQALEALKHLTPLKRRSISESISGRR